MGDAILYLKITIGIDDRSNRKADGAPRKSEDDINEISALVASMRFVPPSVRFGRRR